MQAQQRPCARRSPGADRRIVTGMTTLLTPPPSPSPQNPVPAPRLRSVAARAVDAVKVYGSGEAEVRALDDVTVDFATGRFTAIMGPSGSGKSTLMHSLAGLDTLTARLGARSATPTSASSTTRSSRSSAATASASSSRRST